MAVRMGMAYRAGARIVERLTLPLATGYCCLRVCALRQRERGQEWLGAEVQEGLDEFLGELGVVDVEGETADLAARVGLEGGF